MTDTVGDVIVIGQRKQPNGSFPFPGGWKGDEPAIQALTIEEFPSEPGPQCVSIKARRVWNADAASQEAIAAL